MTKIKLIGTHHHRGCTGHLTGRVLHILDGTLWFVELDHCKHGNDACYAEEKEMKKVALEEKDMLD